MPEKLLRAAILSDADVAKSARLQKHHVTVSGTDGPLVVLLHGFGTDLTVWHKVLPSLESRFRVLRMNMAGAGPHGAESYEAGRYDELETHADDLLMVMEEAGVEECCFVGASVGSMIGLLASIERPNLFRKLIGIGVSPRYLNDGEYVGGFEQEQLNGMFEMMSRDYQGWITGFAPLAVRGLPSSEAVKEFSDSLFSLRPDIALSAARSIFQCDFRRHLALMERPTVLLQTRNDIAVPDQVGEYLRSHMPNAALEILPAEGHFPHLSAPEVVSGALLKHLN
ncbi:alpha/beta fold hydrolase [Terriglobus tenax]|uniref:alpha/beta fold hydrolase n=1 Tax=Terriglobus tenax TaxID=1111115 RepID=UPI0021E00831|nr:alpha/beta hydrolase [Terriglobus tenax]